MEAFHIVNHTAFHEETFKMGTAIIIPISQMRKLRG